MDVDLIVAALDDSNAAWKLSIIGPVDSGFLEEWEETGCDGIPTIEAIDSIRERNSDTRIHLTIIKPEGSVVERYIEVGERGYGHEK